MFSLRTLLWKMFKEHCDIIKFNKNQDKIKRYVAKRNCIDKQKIIQFQLDSLFKAEIIEPCDMIQTVIKYIYIRKYIQN